MTAAERINDWWGRRKQRERLLIIGVVVLTSVLVGDTLALKPMRIQIADASKHLAGARSELTKLQQLVDERDRAGSERLRAREADLKARLSAAEETIRRAQIELVAPQEMARQLSAILERFSALRVVGLVTDAPVPVDESSEKGAKAPVPVNAEERRSLLYEHGLELTVEGHYLDLIAYLQLLERTPYKIYWRELDMKVNDQGVPVTRIHFFTLSKGPTWLTL